MTYNPQYAPQTKMPICRCEALLEGNRCVNSKPHVICLRDHETVHLLKAFGVEINTMDGDCPKREEHKLQISPACYKIPVKCILAYRTKTGFSCPSNDKKDTCPILADPNKRCVVTGR